MAKLDNVDKTCVDCGVLMVNVSPMKKYCESCARKRKRLATVRHAERKKTANMVKQQMKQVRNPNAKYCAGCEHWSSDDNCHCCNYIFNMGHRRPCPPGKDCTVRKNKRKRKETK